MGVLLMAGLIGTGALTRVGFGGLVTLATGRTGLCILLYYTTGFTGSDGVNVVSGAVIWFYGKTGGRITPTGLTGGLTGFVGPTLPPIAA